MSRAANPPPSTSARRPHLRFRPPRAARAPLSAVVAEPNGVERAVARPLAARVAQRHPAAEALLVHVLAELHHEAGVGGEGLLAVGGRGGAAAACPRPPRPGAAPWPRAARAGRRRRPAPRRGRRPRATCRCRGAA